MARIAFFGTPDFASQSLHKTFSFCRQYHHELSLVVCQPDQPQGRGQKLSAPPIKTIALDYHLPVAQPSTLRKNTLDGDEFYAYFKSLNIDLAIVVAYGKLITERLLKIPRAGFVNVHASLLPKFRGAAPIQRAIEAGDRVTGVCLMEMVKGLDEGDIFACQTSPILPFDTSATLFDRLSCLGGTMLFSFIDDILHQRLKKQPQGPDTIYARMLTKDEGLLDFSISGQKLKNKVQAFDPWPGAYGFIRQKRIKFFDSFFIKSDGVKTIPAGTIVTTKPFLGIKTVDGIIYFQQIQIEGKKVLAIKDALLGFPINVGDKIQSSPG